MIANIVHKIFSHATASHPYNREYFYHFVKNDDKYIYRTDGTMIIRLDANIGNIPTSIVEFEALNNLSWPQQTGNRCVILSKTIFHKQNLPKCHECTQSGITSEKQCPSCNGSGSIEFTKDRFNYYNDCKMCNGNGMILSVNRNECPSCLGSGIRWNQWDKKNIKIDDKRFDPRKIWLLVEHLGGGLVFWPDATPLIDTIYFTFVGGDGQLMRLRD